jgi:hypothetical protein
MSMSLPAQIAVHSATYTSTVGAAKNNSSTPKSEQIQEVCETCGQVIETATEYTAGEVVLVIILGFIAMFLIAFGLMMFTNWLFDNI